MRADVEKPAPVVVVVLTATSRPAREASGRLAPGRALARKKLVGPWRATAARRREDAAVILLMIDRVVASFAYDAA